MSNYKKRVKYLRKYGPDILGFTTKKIQNRKNKPGEHPFFVSNKTSVKESFLVRLQNKQKLKLLFCLSERQLKNYLKLSSILNKKKPIITLYNILNLRFDFLVYKNNLTKTILQSRQLIVHGLIKLNGLRLKSPGHICQVGDIITTTSNICLDNIATYNICRVTFDETVIINKGSLIFKVTKPQFIDVNILYLIQQSFEYFF